MNVSAGMCVGLPAFATAAGGGLARAHSKEEK
jgi:hypothetical protein